MKIKLNTKELQAFSRELKKESTTLRNALKRSMVANVMDIQTTAKSQGYVPVLTGNLKRSITHDPITAKGKSISSIIGSNLDYARIQEFGGTTKYGKIKGKKYIQRAFKDNEQKMKERIKKAIALHL